MSDMLCRVQELDNPSLKKKLINEYYSNQQGFSDSKVGGTTVRVNVAVRIIKAEQVIYALEQIDGFDSRVHPDAVEKSKETIRKIKSGELKLPILN